MRVVKLVPQGSNPLFEGLDVIDKTFSTAEEMHDYITKEFADNSTDKETNNNEELDGTGESTSSKSTTKAED